MIFQWIRTSGPQDSTDRLNITVLPKIQETAGGFYQISS